MEVPGSDVDYGAPSEIPVMARFAKQVVVGVWMLFREEPAALLPG
jgi:hypothetical protein